MAEAIPLLLLSGFLGAGKTTLLNRILQGSHGQRVAVLVNDFGAIDIDRRLIAAADGESLQLSNGCICCSIGSSLMEALLRLLARPEPPERLIIEASGVADPSRIAAIGLAGDAFRLEAIVTLVDAETVREREFDPQIGATVRRQIKAADLLILSKTDLVPPGIADDVTAWLRAFSQAPVLSARDEIGGEALLLDPPDRLGSLMRIIGDATHGESVGTLTLLPNSPLRRERLQALVDCIAATAWRAKGFLSLADAPEARQLLQVVGRRWTLSPIATDAPDGIVVIGPRARLDSALLERALLSASVVSLSA